MHIVEVQLESELLQIVHVCVCTCTTLELSVCVEGGVGGGVRSQIIIDWRVTKQS